jgi:hypothetical protein
VALPRCALESGDPEPFQAMFVFVELTVLQRALEEVFEADADKAQLRDGSAFTDDALNSLMGRLRDELMRQEASPLFVGEMGGYTAR